MTKYKIISGIYDDGGKQISYNSTDFFVRTVGGDVKFSTLYLARKTAINMNKDVGKVIAWVVKKIIYRVFDGKNEMIKEDIKEIEDSKSTYELILKYGGDASYFC